MHPIITVAKAQSLSQPMDDWRWGEAHAVHMKRHIPGGIPAIGSWFRGEYSDGRRNETVKAGGFDMADKKRLFARTTAQPTGPSTI